MADPWIKRRTTLDTDPRVHAIADMIAAHPAAKTYFFTPAAADLLGVTPALSRNVTVAVTIVSLERIWITANRHTVTGVIANCDLSYFDTVTGIPGFGAALAAVGWATFDPATRQITLPDFEIWNRPTKGKGTSNALRQKAWRERQKALRDAQNNGNSDANSNALRNANGDAPDGVTKTADRDTDRDNPLITPPNFLALVDSVNPAWAKLPVWSAAETAALTAALPNLQALTEHDWLLLRWFYKWAASPANTQAGKEAERVTSQRAVFLTKLPSILTRANHQWAAHNKPRLGEARRAKDGPSQTGTELSVDDFQTPADRAAHFKALTQGPDKTLAT